MRIRFRAYLVAPLLSIFLAGAALAQYDLSWYSIDGGGAISTTGGEFTLSGTIGQADASAMAMTGGEFELIGGFWAGASSAFCLGDLDGDGEIGLGDLATLLAHYGEPAGMSYADGDLDGDGDVDLSDLATLLALYGTTCG